MVSEKRGLRQRKEKSGGDVFLKSIKEGAIPKHIAIIMDGNGRWARKRGLPRLSGHKAGLRHIQDILKVAQEIGVEFITLYAFSVENWQRPPDEVKGLMHLLKENIGKELERVHRNGIKVNVLGRWRDLQPDIVRELENAIKTTAGNTRGTVNLALNYGGRSEIIDAFRKMSSEVLDGKLAPDDIDEDTIAGHLYSPEIPDPDLLIRTSGELRVSNFLLWQIAYTELWVTPVLWPDFGRDEFLQAVSDFQKRRRRYGGIDEDYG